MKSNKFKSQHISIRITKEQYDKLYKNIIDDKNSFSNFLREAIDEKLAKNYRKDLKTDNSTLKPKITDYSYARRIIKN